VLHGNADVISLIPWKSKDFIVWSLWIDISLSLNSIGCKKYWLMSTVISVLVLVIVYQFLRATPPVKPQPEVLHPTTPPDIHLQQSSKPRMQDLLSLSCGSEQLEIISRVASDCRTFGSHLGLESYIINNVWNVHEAKNDHKCRSIVEQWLIGRGQKNNEVNPITWKTFIGALRMLRHHWLADRLDECVK